MGGASRKALQSLNRFRHQRKNLATVCVGLGLRNWMRHQPNVAQVLSGDVVSIKTRTRLYVTWRNMKSRCYNPSHKSYAIYGAKGISVCQQWRDSFECFKEWAITNGYEEHLTIDRYPDKNGDYEPSNCRWVTWQEQERNRNNNIAPIIAFGETKPIWDWLKDERCKVPRSTLLLRIKTRRDPEWAMTAPAHSEVRRRPTSHETRVRMSASAKRREEKKRWLVTQDSIS